MKAVEARSFMFEMMAVAPLQLGIIHLYKMITQSIQVVGHFTMYS